VLQLLITADLPNSLIPSNLMMEAIGLSETSVLTRSTWCRIPEDDVLHGYRSDNPKSYTVLTGWAL
jgi:hypothetical protein